MEEQKKLGRPPKVKDEAIQAVQEVEKKMEVTETQLKAMIDSALKEQRGKMVEEITESMDKAPSKALKQRYRTVKSKWKIYKLKKDIFFDKQLKDGSTKTMRSFAAGSLYEQDERETKQLGFKINGQGFKIGDPDFFEFVRDEVRSSAEAVLSLAEY